MKGFPVTIRLLDPPLHEFLPKTEAEFGEMARLTGKSLAAIRQRAVALHETNPMLGHRGCRLGITYPEIYEMQAAAIFEAAVEVTQEIGKPVAPEIMVPLIATKKEFDILKAIIDRVGREVMEGAGVSVPYLVGTMIELPRAALRAGEIAENAEFFSFGTKLYRGLSEARDPRSRPVRDARCRRGRRASAHCRRARSRHPAGVEARHLRRTWRRPGLDPLLPRGRARLRLLLALPGADRPPRCGTGQAVGRSPGRNGVTPRATGINLARRSLRPHRRGVVLRIERPRARDFVRAGFSRLAILGVADLGRWRSCPERAAWRGQRAGAGRGFQQWRR